MEYHMLYVKSRKSFEVRRKKTITLPCALVFPCVFLSTLDKIYVCRVPVNLQTANCGADGKSEVSGSEGN